MAIREYFEELKSKSSTHLQSEQTSSDPTEIENTRAIKKTRLRKAKEEKQRYEALKAEIIAKSRSRSLDVMSDSKIKDILDGVKKSGDQL